MEEQKLDLHLASASPRRREILSSLGLVFDALPQQIDESREPGESAEKLVLRLAREKAAQALAGLPPEAAEPVLGADTLVVSDGRILGKPRDRDDAMQMLDTLAGGPHQVLTAVAVQDRQRSELLLARTEVWFRALSAREIEAYWDSGEPRDKAGAYAIQGLGAMFVERIDGSYSNVVGLPVYETVALLDKFGIGVQHILLNAGLSR